MANGINPFGGGTQFRTEQTLTTPQFEQEAVRQIGEFFTGRKPAPLAPQAPTSIPTNGQMDTLGAQPTGIFQAPPTAPVASPAPIAAPPMGALPQAPMADAMLPEGGGIPAPMMVEGGVTPSTPTPEGMRRTLDPLTGEVIFASEDVANQIGAQETERLQAQQRAQEGMTEFFLNQALQPTAFEQASAEREQRLDTMLRDREAARQAQRGGEAEMTTEERQAEAEAQIAEAQAEAARKALRDPDISEYERFQSELALSDLSDEQKRAATLRRFGLDPLDYPEGGEGVSTAETQDAGSTPATSTNIPENPSEDEYNALPSGAKYIYNGKEYTKK